MTEILLLGAVATASVVEMLWTLMRVAMRADGVEEWLRWEVS